MARARKLKKQTLSLICSLMCVKIVYDIVRLLGYARGTTSVASDVGKYRVHVVGRGTRLAEVKQIKDVCAEFVFVLIKGAQKLREPLSRSCLCHYNKACWKPVTVCPLNLSGIRRLCLCLNTTCMMSIPDYVNSKVRHCPRHHNFCNTPSTQTNLFLVCDISIKYQLVALEDLPIRLQAASCENRSFAHAKTKT